MTDSFSKSLHLSHAIQHLFSLKPHFLSAIPELVGHPDDDEVLPARGPDHRLVPRDPGLGRGVVLEDGVDVVVPVLAAHEQERLGQLDGGGTLEANRRDRIW